MACASFALGTAGLIGADVTGREGGLTQYTCWGFPNQLSEPLNQAGFTSTLSDFRGAHLDRRWRRSSRF
jgi:hypothetical protein